MTGGARGIGLEMCRQLADQGLRVLVGARGREAAEEAWRVIGPAALPLALDVTSAKSVTQAVREATGLTGGIDVLVNNAGVSLDRELRPPNVDEDILRATLDTNLTGAWRVAEAVVPGMVEAGYGRVVNVTSSYGSLALTDSGRHPAYRISKTALNALTRMLAAELSGTGVLVNAADPGWTRSGRGGHPGLAGAPSRRRRDDGRAVRRPQAAAVVNRLRSGMGPASPRRRRCAAPAP
ncbi:MULTISPECIES: SDR family NAD(P)-dependent oxidoreductase [unclassified Streptomyces]|uniref:SDR family NAD(P)-dependent oxidoreductase n=1 Tax=unclassified Streptomyces TaxID=2593676 RepID=UPI00224DA961|nr:MULTISPECIES: SDR family NAD(P)-dependent oxidoreductase [unclassified Streptomyces]MCX5337260.1 SDR family NAD(P)-dependent oxidoreductase [Streptomyces sp. NBC_00140]MCX5365789.1 SDR family NAD(P)-dependent oxidoreductase [Streptomyces sp. NBC_00124]